MERPRGGSQGTPSSSQGAASAGDPQAKALVTVRGGLAASELGQRNPSLSFPEGSVTLRRQEELEATCTQLQRQVGEMEVREAVARAVCPQGLGQSPPHWTPRPTPHRVSPVRTPPELQEPLPFNHSQYKDHTE